jgi:LuxR family maltose regulon positive regulatory protein
VREGSMSTPVLATKLYVPAPPAKAVMRSRLVERIQEGLHRNLTLVSSKSCRSMPLVCGTRRSPITW